MRGGEDACRNNQQRLLTIAADGVVVVAALDEGDFLAVAADGRAGVERANVAKGVLAGACPAQLDGAEGGAAVAAERVVVVARLGGGALAVAADVHDGDEVELRLLGGAVGVDDHLGRVVVEGRGAVGVVVDGERVRREEAAARAVSVEAHGPRAHGVRVGAEHLDGADGVQIRERSAHLCRGRRGADLRRALRLEAETEAADKRVKTNALLGVSVVGRRRAGHADLDRSTQKLVDARRVELDRGQQALVEWVALVGEGDEHREGGVGRVVAADDDGAHRVERLEGGEDERRAVLHVELRGELAVEAERVAATPPSFALQRDQHLLPSRRVGVLHLSGRRGRRSGVAQADVVQLVACVQLTVSREADKLVRRHKELTKGGVAAVNRTIRALAAADGAAAEHLPCGAHGALLMPAAAALHASRVAAHALVAARCEGAEVTLAALRHALGAVGGAKEELLARVRLVARGAVGVRSRARTSLARGVALLAACRALGSGGARRAAGGAHAQQEEGQLGLAREAIARLWPAARLAALGARLARGGGVEVEADRTLVEAAATVQRG
eukprot:4559877-Pleurochrysis_carterae.AAC.6